VAGGPEPIRRRAITFVPARDALVTVEHRKRRPAGAPEHAPLAA